MVFGDAKRENPKPDTARMSRSCQIGVVSCRKKSAADATAERTIPSAERKNGDFLSEIRPKTGEKTAITAVDVIKTNPAFCDVISFIVCRYIESR